MSGIARLAEARAARPALEFRSRERPSGGFGAAGRGATVVELPSASGFELSGRGPLDEASGSKGVELAFSRPVDKGQDLRGLVSVEGVRRPPLYGDGLDRLALFRGLARLGQAAGREGAQGRLGQAPRGAGRRRPSPSTGRSPRSASSRRATSSRRARASSCPSRR